MCIAADHDEASHDVLLVVVPRLVVLAVVVEQVQGMLAAEQHVELGMSLAHIIGTSGWVGHSLGRVLGVEPQSPAQVAGDLRPPLLVQHPLQDLAEAQRSQGLQQAAYKCHQISFSLSGMQASCSWMMLT